MSVKKELLNGVFWNIVSRYSSILVGMVISMILARLLVPENYGVVSIAMTLLGFLSMFSSLGIASAIIQRRDLTKNDYDSIFTITLIIGFVLTLLFFACSWPIAKFYKNPQLIPVCQILSIQILLGSANMVPGALLSHERKFKILAIRGLFFQLLTGPMAIAAAYYGAGVYALVISPTVSSIGVLIWNCRYYKLKVTRHLSLAPIKKIFSFSAYQFLFEFVNYFSRNFDKLIIGRLLGLALVGIYNVAYALMMYPMGYISSVLNPVLHPVLSTMQDNPKEMAVKYGKLVKVVATMSFPLGIIFSGLSPDLIHFVYGHKWDAAIPVSSILALSVPLQMILSTSGAVFMSCNNTKMNFWVGIRNTLTTVIGFIIAAVVFKSLKAMAWSWTITLAINFCFSYWLLYKYVLKASVLSMLKYLVKPAMTSAVIWVLLMFLNSLNWGEGVVVPLLCKGLISVATVLILIQLTGQYDIKALAVKVINKIFRRNAAKTTSDLD